MWNIHLFIWGVFVLSVTLNLVSSIAKHKVSDIAMLMLSIINIPLFYIWIYSFFHIEKVNIEFIISFVVAPCLLALNFRAYFSWKIKFLENKKYDKH